MRRFAHLHQACVNRAHRERLHLCGAVQLQLRLQRCIGQRARASGKARKGKKLEFVKHGGGDLAKGGGGGAQIGKGAIEEEAGNGSLMAARAGEDGLRVRVKKGAGGGKDALGDGGEVGTLLQRGS